MPYAMERLDSNPVTRMRRSCRKPISSLLPRKIGVMNRHRRGESVSHNPPFPPARAKMMAFLARVAMFALGAFAGATPASAAAPEKVLRVAYLIAETNFDPAATSDTYSGNIEAEIFESPLTYDFLARPAKLKPLTL